MKTQKKEKEKDCQKTNVPMMTCLFPSSCGIAQIHCASSGSCICFALHSSPANGMYDLSEENLQQGKKKEWGNSFCSFFFFFSFFSYFLIFFFL